MGLLDDYSGTSGLAGLGMSPRPANDHQYIMSTLEFKLNLKLYKLGYWSMSEPAIWKQSKNDKAPDVVIYKKTNNDPDKWVPLVFIEIEKAQSVKKNAKKCIEIMQLVKSVKEAFIYDYESEIWYRFTGNENTSYCDTFKIDLRDFVIPM